MSIDDSLRDMFNKAIPPADTPSGLADQLIARSATTGSAGAGGGTAGAAGGFGLPLIIGLAVASGIVVGGVFGLFGGGGTPSTAATVDINAVPVYACPGEGEVGTLFRGDRVLITGRSGDWVAVRNVRGSNERVFVRADYVDPDADISGLPEENCDDAGMLTLAGVPIDATATTPPDTATTTVAPGTTTTTTVPPGSTTSTTSTTATPPSTTTSTSTTTLPPTTTSTSTTTLPPTTTTTTTSTTTTTTQAPDTTPPNIANGNVTPGQIWEQDGLGISCPANTPRDATITAFVTDNVAVTSVTATWTDPLGNQSVPMTRSGDTYTATIGPYAAGTWDPANLFPYDHAVTVTITARDAAGNKKSTTVLITVTEIGQCFI